ncbi:glycosyltransferase family 4 protein [Tenacibaculum aiptasiae]|uniref:glycosyltransferase family 4 protein n=1 Tax=Tenacibaculum aiptasiae TaxID=426481 RepID=UPI00232BE7A5|nr:glycosyltransferase family 1 protein [Tenacibaculum aiptasiae]
MILGIDATNIRSGGGLTHLKEILAQANPKEFGFEKVVIWSNSSTLEKLPNYSWLDKVSHKLLNKSFVYSFLFQMFFLSKKAKLVHNCDLLFVPGGTFLGSFKDIVTMSRNMLPFEKTEYLRFNSLKSRLRFKILYYTQSLTFKKASRIIFLTNYAKSVVNSSLDIDEEKTTIIPHGTNVSFLKEPVIQREIDDFNGTRPFRLLYVSVVTAYKHQWNVAAAVLKLKKEGYPVTLDLVGDITEESKLKLETVLKSELNSENTVNYLGLVPYDDLAEYYFKANGFVFASSCENMPNILIEAMTSGLPIACSNFGPMPEVLGDAGVYFDPTNVNSIYEAIKLMLNNKQLRENISNKSFKKSINYTWKHCSDETFKYLSEVIKNK